MSTPIILCGALGKMGQQIIEQVKYDDNFSLTKGVVKNLKTKINNNNIKYFTSLKNALIDEKQQPVIIDFSVNSMLKEHLELACCHHCPILVATTGHDGNAMKLIDEAAQKTAVLYAPNTSLLANLMLHLCKIASSHLKSYDTAISEIHHHHKKDAPSGTAIALAQAIKTQRGNDAKVEMSSLRIGEVKGEHTAYFVNSFDRLEITHRVDNRQIFAQGALIAAQFIFNKPAGLYHMDDVLLLDF